MQTLLAFLPVAQAAPNGNPVNAILEHLRQQSQADAGTSTLVFLVSQVVAIIAILIASKTVVAEQYRDTFGNALRVWISQWLVTIVGAVVMVIAFFVLNAANALQFTAIVVIGIPLVMLIMMIRIPMGIYQIGFFRAIGLLILAFVISIIGTFAARFVVGPSPAKEWEMAKQMWNFSPEQWKQLGEGLRKERQATSRGEPMLPGEKEARDTSKPLQERADALKTMYAELERIRQAVPPGDDAAKASYDRQKARYEALLDQLKAEAKAQGTGSSQ